jgi:hypothetical protein
MRSAPSLSLDIAPSRRAQSALGVMLVLAFVSVWLSDLPLFARNFFGIAVWIFGAGAWRTMLKPTLHRAVLQSDGIWLLSTPQGDIAAQLQSSSLLGGLIGLRWRDTATQREISWLIWPDALAETQRRPLRVWLRSGRAHAVESAKPDAMT